MAKRDALRRAAATAVLAAGSLGGACLGVGVPALAQTDAAPVSRYQLERVGDALYRLDTVSGDIERCMVSDDGLRCTLEAPAPAVDAAGLHQTTSDAAGGDVDAAANPSDNAPGPPGVGTSAEPSGIASTAAPRGPGMAADSANVRTADDRAAPVDAPATVAALERRIVELEAELEAIALRATRTLGDPLPMANPATRAERASSGRVTARSDLDAALDATETTIERLYDMYERFGPAR